MIVEIRSWERYKFARSTAHTEHYTEEMGKVTRVIGLVTFLGLCTTLQSAPAPEIIDLGYGLDEKSQYWPGTQRYNITLETTARNVNGIPW